ncbi:MAG TPA: HD domain-containing phosphohydrolase [Thermoleophilia bacterium]|nr:HD domain-containing phosphohydrolase [Thermoleophilia bacterium]
MRSRIATGLHVSRSPVRTKLALAFLVASLLPLVVFAVASMRSAERSLHTLSAGEMSDRDDALRAALDSRGRAIVDQVLSYGEWTDFALAMDRRDVGWLEDNATTRVTDNSALKGAQALALDGEVVSAAGDFKDASLHQTPVVVAAGDAGENGFDFRVVDGDLFIVGAGPIVEQDVENSPRHGIVVFGEPVNGAMLAELASFVGASEVNVYEDGRLVASSASSEATGFPLGLRVGTALTSGSDTFLLTELRDRAGVPQAVLGLKVDNAAVSVTMSSWRKTATYALAAALFVALIVGLVVTRMLSRPLQRLATAARAMAGGATLQRVDIESHDEFGEVAAAFNTMSEQLSDAFAELQLRSDTDALTGLLNYRAIHRALDKETARGRRYGVRFSVVVVDVDNLKLLNDTHGHLAGDYMLRQLGHILSEHTRQADSVGRHGGDEFMIILPETGADDAAVVAEKVRAAVSAEPYVADDDLRIPVHVSMGIASFPEDGGDATSLLLHADANLYASKREGGDAVTSTKDRHEPAEMSGAFGMLEGLVTSVDNKDNYTHRHSREVTEHALAMAAALDLPEQARRIVRVAGLLHDVGKIGVPDGILRKPGRLTDEEYEVVKQHPTLGEVIIREIPDLEEICGAIVAHHERWDGAGYPHGLKGESIPLLARILGVADAYSAMTSDRPYRMGMSPQEAIAELRACAGSQFDPALVELFVETRAAAEDEQDVPADVHAEHPQGTQPEPAQDAPPELARTVSEPVATTLQDA